MKKVICVVAVLVFVLTMAIPCFAAESENSEIQPRGSAVRYTNYDSVGNTYVVAGTTSFAGYTAMAYTSFEVQYAAGGDTSKIAEAVQVVSTDGTVYFTNGTSINTWSLDGTKTYSPGKSSGTVNISKNLSEPVSMVSCVHTFNAGGNSGVTFTTTA